MIGTDILRDLWERPAVVVPRRRIVLWVRPFENDCWLVEVENNMYEVVRPESAEWSDRPVCRKCRQ